MTRKQPASGSRPTVTSKPDSDPAYLDHGVPSLVAQDNPDDSQLGAPKTAGQRQSTPTG